MFLIKQFELVLENSIKCDLPLT